MRIITLLSDLGSRDQYVSEMKGTILSLCPSATVVDITHEVEKFDVRMGAFLLAAASRCFPAGTVHIVVVDPGVGGPRRDLLIEGRRAVYIGPDNGVLIPAASGDGIKQAYSIENPEFMRTPVSPTFHGRDVFAYTAGRIASGADLSQVGPKASNLVSAAFPEASSSPGKIKCEVVRIDSFGNIVTTANGNDLELSGMQTGTKIKARVKGRLLTLDLVRTYSDSPERKPVLLVGSHGFAEIAMNKGNAARRLGLRSGDQLIFLGCQGCRS